MSVISNDRDPITLEPLENCKRKFSFIYKNVKTVYDFDNYNKNIKKIGPIKPHTGERLNLEDKLSMNKIWTHFKEPIPFPEAEEERKRNRRETCEAVITFIIIVPIMILEFIFLIRCNGLRCLGLSF